jgi:cobyrinic acid a,c-diamide synthase
VSGGLIFAAPASGSGKTLIVLGLLRCLVRQGLAVRAAKSGPDYIDSGFHSVASGAPCLNLDAWAMRKATLALLISELQREADLVLCEGAMGLFDGAGPSGEEGSTAALAALTGWPVILIADVRGQAASAAALLRGFASHRADVPVAGAIFNRVGGARHQAVLASALARTLPELPILGMVPRDAGLLLAERHLGLVQAVEQENLDRLIEQAADLVAASIDIPRLLGLARPSRLPSVSGESVPPPVPVLGQRIAVARDIAFGFAYPALLETWRAAGAELAFFSPLADEAPPPDADAVYLPGGYPELHAGRLAAASRFCAGMHGLREKGAWLYGECGGYMVLGEGLVDAAGQRHAMLGMLPLTTSFAQRRLHLGYREARVEVASPFGPAGSRFRAHEFHYASILAELPGQALFTASTASGDRIGAFGLVCGRVMGSFLHLIDRIDEEPDGIGP